MVVRLGTVGLPQHRDAGARGLAGELAVLDELRGKSLLQGGARMLDVLSEECCGNRLRAAIRRNRHLRGQRVRSGLDIRGELLVRERALPDAHLIVVRTRVAVHGVLRTAEEETWIDYGRERPSAVELAVLALDLAGLRVTAHRAHPRRAVSVVLERHGDVVRRSDFVRTQRLERRALLSVAAHLDAVRAGLVEVAPRHREVVLVVRAVVEDARPWMDGVERSPHLDRDVRAIRRKEIPPEVEMARPVLAAGHDNPCRMCRSTIPKRHNIRKERFPYFPRLYARHGIFRVPGEAPAVHKHDSRISSLRRIYGTRGTRGDEQ